MAKLDAYLFFDGNCADAMRFYEKTLGGKLQLLTYGASPAAGHVPPGGDERIIHARLEVGEGVLLAGDTPVGQPLGKLNAAALSLIYPTVDEARKKFDALADGGKVAMAFGKTFFADGFGMLADRFGTSWMVGGGRVGAP